MTIASGEVNTILFITWQDQRQAATSGFFSAFNIPFESNASINRKENIFFVKLFLSLKKDIG